MRVAFVTPRYGPEVVGGAEAAARQLAEHLVAGGLEVEIYTSCALNHITWDDVLEPGDSVLNGVTVHRFAATSGRTHDFYALDGRLRTAPSQATWRESQEWVELNGPVIPSLVEAVTEGPADVTAFYPYMYYPTVRAIGKIPMPAVLHPAAHDEPALYLPVFRGTYGSADALCYHTVSERQLVQRVHSTAGRPQIVLGLGVADPEEDGKPGGEVLGIGDRPYAVSVGRVDDHKGSSMLAAFFRTYKERHPGPLALALVGPVAAKIPPHPDVILTGMVSEGEKGDLVRDSLASISPSALESFSLVVLEAWQFRRPVVVNGTCGPTREHCERSGGGLWFSSYREFEAVLERLEADSALRARLGERGKAYVDEYYQWPVLIERYRRFLAEVTDRGRQPTVWA